jgi:hypothetical protein
MVYFQTQNPNLGKLWRAKDRRMLIYLNILRTFEIFYDHLVHFVLIWYIFSGFGTMYQEKSGNLAQEQKIIRWNPAGVQGFRALYVVLLFIFAPSMSVAEKNKCQKNLGAVQHNGVSNPSPEHKITSSNPARVLGLL